jgi:hypothetical protein
MLASLLGVRLILWLGQTIPTPPPSSVMDALTKVQVTNDAQAGDGFSLTFALGKDQSLEWDLLASGVLSPMTRVWIGVVLGVTPEVLIDGIITHHQLSPSADPGMSTLTVMGTNLTVMLDLEEKNQEYKNQPDFLIVTRLLLDYPQFGLVPTVTPTTDVPIELQRIPRQHETDLAFIQRMAERNGFVFYIEPVTFGVNTAFWGVETRTGVPQPALTMNVGSLTNVTSLSFANDALAPVGAPGSFVEPITKTQIPIPALPSLRLPPLSAAPAPVFRTVLLRDTANENPAQAALSSAAAATRAPDPVTGQGQLETVTYGSILRARGLVGVRGAGMAYDGTYYVSRVTHDISRGTYTQSFSLSREGTGSLLPVVVP